MEQLAWRSTRSALRAAFGQSFALFAAAGTFAYWQAWIYLLVGLGSSVATNAYLLRHDRALLRRRLAMEEVGERDPVHKRLVMLLIVLGLGLYVVCGLDRRFGWTIVPQGLALLGFLLLASGTWLIFLTFRTNTFGGSTVTVESRQRVISSGPYRLVRHPMYSGMLLATFATPLCLGSYAGEILFFPIAALFVLRLRAEEELLRADLPGYAEYMLRTPQRLIPRVW